MTQMKAMETLYVTSRDDWRAWLGENHKIRKEIWLIYYKKHTGKPRIPYDDAVEEALCYGWIDSLVRRIDDEKYAQKFTPRKKKSNWSELNKKRAEKMINKSRMTKAGLDIFKDALPNNKKDVKPKSPKNGFAIPPDLKKALKTDSKVWRNFSGFPPSYQKQCVGWITSAKKEETRARRLAEIIKLTSQKKKIGMK